MQYSYPAVTLAAKLRVSSKYTRWALIGIGVSIFLFGATVFALIIGALVVYTSGRILPGVSVGDVSLGGLTADAAKGQLAAAWSQIKIRDGQRVWTVTPAQLGLSFDLNATVQAAQKRGRGDEAWLSALYSDNIAPVVTVNQPAAQAGIKNLTNTVNQPATNATIRIDKGGNVVMVPATSGETLDVGATLQKLVASPGSEFTDGAFDLVMTKTQPTVTDASGQVDQARRLLASPLTINAFDPIQNQTAAWVVPNTQWGDWLTTASGPSGTVLSLSAIPLTNYLTGQNQKFTDGRHIDLTKSVTAVQTAVSTGQPNATIQVMHSPTQYLVKYGDTIGSIAWDKGLPMWRIANANPGISMDTLNPGQEITIPSLDDMISLPVVMNKRIVVSISKQHMWVYENGNIKWDWVASTGIPSSPTFPGVFQVQSHEVNAYAGNWNLWMPHFMSIYESVPGFWNGIHGFPTRDGVGLLWQGDLGHKVTFGCVLVSSTNAAALYDWAEEGVIVEIQA